jgi:hypothetical protein
MNEPPPAFESVIQSVDSKISAVRTSSLDFSFNELADMHRTGELIIAPEFQRMFRWSEGSQSRFVESLILELPVPPIFLIEREDRIYELIDGLQRVSSYLHFWELLTIDGVHRGALVLNECDIVKELNGYTHRTLPRPLSIKLKRSYIRAEILRKESDKRLRYHMFKRLNTGGEELSDQEVRNATIRLLSNDFNIFIIQLSENPDFVHCINIISENARMKKFDQELVLRFLAFKNDFNNYTHELGEFLTDYMEKVSDPASGEPFDYDAERKTFEKTFRIYRIISDHLGINSKIFGAMGGTSTPTKQFSVYHYEGLTLGLQAIIDEVDPNDNGLIKRLAEAVSDGKKDQDFLNFVGSGKNYSGPLRARREYFSKKFLEALS